MYNINYVSAGFINILLLFWIMNACQIFIFNALLVLCNATIAKEDPVVETKYGIVKGYEAFSRFGRTYYAFKGIPYARPPIKNLRFKAPLEPIRWPGILKTQENAPYCLQKEYLFSNPTVVGSEDCLYLNVYTPKLRARRQSLRRRLLPVMVFIHWGGFFSGFASSDYLGPEYFMDKNVILVTFNYRLGVLGFLSTNDDSAPGNYGLKDQVAALKWVQSNIQFFGGNNEQVTIFGQSAGGVSVNYHMFSPQSRNLFHRAISQSGSSLAIWAKPVAQDQLLIAKTQAKLVGCQQHDNTSVLVDCLRLVKAEDLVESGDKFKFFSIDPLNIYLPSIEKETERNPHPFITKAPIDYIRNKEFYNVPWIIGVVNEEGLLRAEAMLRQPETREALIENFNSLMPILIALHMSSPHHNIQSIWTKIKNFYFTGQGALNITDPYSIKGFINLYSDRSFIYSSYQAAMFHNLKGHEDIWFYNFNYTGRYSYGNIFAATKDDINYKWGVSHCDDLLYLFKTPAFFPELNDSNDQIMIQTMTDLWTNFAIYGHPTPRNGLTKPTAEWLKLENNVESNLRKKIHYMNIVGHHNDSIPPRLTMEYGFYKNRVKFWEDLPLVENIEELNQEHIAL